MHVHVHGMHNACTCTWHALPPLGRRTLVQKHVDATQTWMLTLNAWLVMACGGQCLNVQQPRQAQGFRLESSSPT